MSDRETTQLLPNANLNSLTRQTNGFRFTFMCPTNSFYNDRLMSCEFNKTLSRCVSDRDNANMKTNGQNVGKEIAASAGERVEVVERTGAEHNSTEAKSNAVTTIPQPKADPYLTKWRGQRTTTTEADNRSQIKSKNNTHNNEKQINAENETKTSKQNIVSNAKNLTQSIVPFRGFRNPNRTKVEINAKNTTNVDHKDYLSSIKSHTEVESKTQIRNTTKQNQSSSTVKVAVNAKPVLNSIRRPVVNSVNAKNVNTRGRTPTTTTTTPVVPIVSTTTTSLPSLMRPTTKETTTISPLDSYFTPVFNSETIPINADFFPLSLHQRPESNEKDKTKRTTPMMTQNFFSEIHHMPQRRPSNVNHEVSASQPIIDFNQRFSSFFPSVMSRYQIPGHNFNRAALFETNNESKIDSGAEAGKEEAVTQLVQNLKHIDLDSESQESGLSEVETHFDPSDSSEPSEGLAIDRKGKARRRKRKPKLKKVVTVPLLVPTGVSKRELRRRLSTTLLKPTVIPSPISGQQMPAYILQFQESDRSRKMKSKHRAKRQAFNWNNPFASNPFHNHFNHMTTNSIGSPVYSHFDNFISNAFPSNSYNGRQFIEIGERPGMRMNAMAQHNLPSYHKRPNVSPVPPLSNLPVGPHNNLFGPNFYRDNNIYDLSDFSDFYDNPLTRRPSPIMSNDVPYRSVSLKRPAFKRPPRREKVPQISSDRNITKKMEVRTTLRPFNPMPVSARPFSHPIPTRRQPFFPILDSNPFTDFSDDSVNEAIKVFDSSDDNLQTLDSDFGSSPLLPFKTPRSFSSDFVPITPRVRSNGLNERSSRINTFSQPPINSFDSFIPDFHSLPKFGGPEYRLPFADISQTKSGQQTNNQNNKEIVDKTNTTRHPTPYIPEVVYESNTEMNQTERNPNHNYDSVDNGGGDDIRRQETVRSDQPKPQFSPLIASTLKWENIVGQFDKSNISRNSDHRIDSKLNGSTNNMNGSVSYGTRLSGTVNRYSQSPDITVKASVSSLSSMRPEASNQVIVSRKLGSDPDSSGVSQKEINDINNNDMSKDKSVDELYNQRAFDRLMLFNYYNNINTEKPRTSTTTVAPDSKYPSTSAWSIRDWTGQYYTTSSTTTSAPMPVVTVSNANIEPIDLYESESRVETTTASPEKTVYARPEPPYRKIFRSQMGATLHSGHTANSPHSYNKYSKVNIQAVSAAEKTRSDISNYLSSLTSVALPTA